MKGWIFAVAAAVAVAGVLGVTGARAAEEKVAAAPASGEALGFTVKDIDGKDVNLSQYKGKVVMIINVASKCGNTKQYTGLETMYQKYKDQGFVILGFPANNFGGQEPASEAQIKEFCTGAGFHPEFTGRENIHLAAQLHGITPQLIANRLDNILAFADLPPAFLDQPVKTYSSGMFVRLAFAIIAHVDAETLFIDEALAVGDVYFVQKCFRFLRDFQDAGKTILVVSHDAAALQSLCHQVLWLDEGTLKQIGPSKTVLQNYLAASHGFDTAAGLRGVTVSTQADVTSTNYGARGATIHSITLTDEHNAPITTLTAPTPAILTLNATAHRPLTDIILGFFLKDRLGQNLFGDNTHVPHPGLAANTDDAITAQFHFTIPLLPAGQYTLAAALAEGSQQSHEIQHWRHDALTLISLTKNDALGLVGIPTSATVQIGSVASTPACDVVNRNDILVPAARRITPLALLTPELLSDCSAWIPHLPFAFTLVALLRPRTLVELGTHKGDSYCAFCQAIAWLNLGTGATAIDTWAGDASAGLYDHSVLEQLRQPHDTRYGHFSNLLQSTFEDAVRHFPDNSIDLLHIDGNHTYEAVRRDFQTWLPKLSDRSVVLLHDTQVTTNNFGVHQLFSELKGSYRHFEFPHAYGLGLLVTGQQPPLSLLEFLDHASENASEIHALYAALGHRLELQRTINLLRSQLQLQTSLTKNWRQSIDAPRLPNFPDPCDFIEPKQFHDQLAWHAAALTGDLNHLLRNPKR